MERDQEREKTCKILTTGEILVKDIWVFIFYSFKFSVGLKNFKIKGMKENIFFCCVLYFSLEEVWQI